ncbi:MAG: multiprotein-bridging factor 1 family protein [Candidatus Bilamarchaeaceae archaeon]
MKAEETCEICGQPGLFAIVIVEGARLSVCARCARGKKILYRLAEEGEESEHRPTAKTSEEEEIVEGYGEIIRKARERMGVSIEVVAERINESASYLERIERESVMPTLVVARKLEKELGIKLIEKVSSSIAPSFQKTRYAEPTLGDFTGE